MPLRCSQLANLFVHTQMKKLLTFSFILDLLAGLGSIAYGIYADSAWWVGGGVAGLIFSFVWRAIQPKLIGKVMRKRAGAAAAPVSAPSAVVRAPTGGEVQQPDVFAGRRMVSPGEPHPETGISWNRFSAAPPKKGQLRYY